MKRLRNFFLVSILTLFEFSCYTGELECPIEYETQNLMPEDIAFFPYVKGDTLKCNIDSIDNIICIDDTALTTRDSIAFPGYNPDCGPNKILDSERRTVTFFTKDTHEKVFSIGIGLYPSSQLNSGLSLKLNSYVPTINSFELNFSIYSLGKTETINGVLYTDLIIFQFSDSIYFYSKSKGLIKIIVNSKAIFQITP